MSSRKLNSQAAEILAKWYLRFNGYFSVENFIVHAGDDPTRISINKVGNHTETDLLAIRHKYSKEVSGNLHIQNDPNIVTPSNSLIDFIIAEVKTGNQNKPNKLWTEKKIPVIEYILRFAGFIESEKAITKVAKELATKGFFLDRAKKYSIRLIMISETKPNKIWQHLNNILFEDIINFLVDVRGQSWANANIGTASIHYQWEGLIIKLFEIANNHNIDRNTQKQKIKDLLQENK
jgi:hypothetical protein